MKTIFTLLFCCCCRPIVYCQTQQQIALYTSHIELLDNIRKNHFDEAIFLIERNKLMHSNSSLLKELALSLSAYSKGNHRVAYEKIYYQIFLDQNLSVLDSACIHQQLGIYFLDAQDFVNAQTHLLKALQAVKRAHVRHDFIKTWLVELYRNWNKPEKALPYARELFEIKEAADIIGLTNLATLYQDVGKIDSSNYCLAKAEIYLTKKFSKEDADFIYFLKGKNAQLKGKNDQAIVNYLKVVKDTQSTTNWYPYISSNLELITLYLKSGNKSACRRYLKSFYLCPCLSLDVRVDLINKKAEIYQNLGDHKMYLELLETSSDLKDQLITNSIKDHEKLSELNGTYFNLLEESIKVKSENIHLNQQKSRIFMLLFLITLLGLGFSYLFYRKQLNRKQALFRINEELTDSKLELYKAKEEMLSIKVRNQQQDLMQLAKNLTVKRSIDENQKTELKEWMNLSDKELKTRIKKWLQNQSILEGIQANLEAFQANLDVINAQFLNYMKIQFPFLSKHDIDICSMHLLGLTTKEIATLRNVSVKSVQISRYRLKKKFQLLEEDDLLDFLKKQLFLSTQ